MTCQSPPTIISSFRGPWAFLSNFYACNIVYEDLEFPSVEHAFQATKTLDDLRLPFTNADLKPGQAKAKGRELVLRPDWEQVKIKIMLELLLLKFRPSLLQRQLLATMQAKLVEGNYWHDTFWGVCNGTGNHYLCAGHLPYGANHLGILLMDVRRFYGVGK